MRPFSDYHMHTPLCGHAVGEPEEYVRQAIKVGLKEIGFSDHAPLLSYDDPSITMSRTQLPQYHKMIEDVRKKYPQIRILTGIEADFLPGYEKETKELLAGYPYDYVIGSVHFIKSWAFDNPDHREEWMKKDVNRVYRDYYEVLRQSAASGLFTVLAHVDLVKKFGNMPTEDFSAEVAKTAKVFKSAGVLIEINTSGLRKPVKEIFPSLANLKVYQKAGVPITFGSDAHDPQDVGRDFDKGAAWAKEAGYKEYVLLRNRKIDRSVKL
ncbi:MAG TPA: histidinol-phosphatase HisJ [Candidatus Omnitrophota bacterium]|nr:histidinol-phosphatase HisJ [Candidatus Omnitrophota bacterium]HPD85360.1 histidinol-phosphatase HisJ [Candidatus Omnitrophota bacterium]HRZ04139.1 histidinol-phosphatase HisJ [Candidatus Omnitrophota bacterium]